MEATQSDFNYIDSDNRITEILNTSDNDYVDKTSIPARSELTFKNGFYVDCGVLFIDIRGSKGLAIKHTRPVLAKIYRAYVSESIAVMRWHGKVSEISIEGDCVWGAFDTPLKGDIDELLSVAAVLSSLVNILNWRISGKGYSGFAVGIGLSYGSALMIKAGAQNSGINDIVYMGTVVGEAAKLCGYGSRDSSSSRLYVSNAVFQNLSDGNKRLLTKDFTKDCYRGTVINTEMEEWLNQQRQ